MRTIRPTNVAALLFVLSTAAQGQDPQPVEEEPGPLEQTVPVASENAEITDVAADEVDLPPTEDDLLAEFAHFRDLIAERNYDAADASAKRVVEMAIRIHGPQSLETSKALSNLGLVQHNNKQFDAAIQNYTASIEIIENVEDRLNQQLVNPLKGLGAAQLGSGRPDLATATFGRATHITHVNEGPHNIEQVELLESMAEANVRLGDIEVARDILDRIHYLNVRHFDDDALGLLPSLMRRADWQHRAGYYNDERATYRRTIRIIETSSDKNDPRLITPLVKLGETYYYYQPVTEGARGSAGMSGETYFKRAVRISEKTPDLPWLEVANTRLALADYYGYYGGTSRSRKIYREVWSELSTDEDRLAARKELLEQVVLLREEPLPRYASGDSAASRDGFLSGNVQVDFTISARGTVKDVESQANPAEFTAMQRTVHREVRGRFFRPRMIDADPVETPGQVFTHEFLYQQAELDELRLAARQREAEKQR